MAIAKKKIPAGTTVSADEKAQQAYYVCLLTPLNESVSGTTFQIENLITLLEKSKNERNFRETLTILKNQVHHQTEMITHLSEIILSMERVYHSSEPKDEDNVNTKIH